MMFWYGHDIGGWGYAGMAIGMVLFWALIVGGIVVLVRFAGGDQVTRYTMPPEQPDPQHLLAVRFARGEINETEYREKLALLRDHAGM